MPWLQQNVLSHILFSSALTDRAQMLEHYREVYSPIGLAVDYFVQLSKYQG